MGEDTATVQDFPSVVPPMEKPKAEPVGGRGLSSRDGFQAAVRKPRRTLEKAGGSEEDAALLSDDTAGSAAAAPRKDPAAERVKLALTADAGAAGAPKRRAGKKRWLAGRGSQKRRKLEENKNLVDWLVANGVYVSDKADWGQAGASVSIAVETREQQENEASGRGVVASRDINLYETLAQVPVRMLFSKESARDKFGPECISDSLSEYASIALHLLSERYIEGDNSFWQPYIAVLPSTEEIGASFTWDDEELQDLLYGSPLQNMSMFIRIRVGEEYQRIRTDIMEKHPDKFPTDVFTEERYVWAYAILFSRAVRLAYDEGEEEIIALVPYIDLINHSPFSDTYISGARVGIELPMGLQEKERVVVVKSDQYYQQYDQIYISYGPKSNAYLLMLYGFCLERNSKDHVEIVVQTLMDDDPFRQAKESFADQVGIDRVAYPLYRDRYTNDMMAYMRLAAILPSDLDLPDDVDQEGFVQGLRRVNFFGINSEVPERRALEKLKKLCDDLLAGYPTTLEEDEQLVQDRTTFELLPKNQRMAIRVRYQEKLIMRATMVTIDRVVNNLQTVTKRRADKKREEEEEQNTFMGRMGFKVDPAIKATSLEEWMKELDI